MKFRGSTRVLFYNSVILVYNNNSIERNVIMTTNRIAILPGVWLNTVQTDRFKTGCFSVNLLRPLAYADAAPNALLPSVLLRGCRDYPDMQAISQRLDELYGASVGTLVRKKGEVQIVGLYLDFLEDRYAGGEPLFSEMMELLRQLLFEPCLEAGGFVGEFVEGETLNLSNTIAARINEKRSYAISRLMKSMCQGETYAVPRLGEAETLKTVTPKNLLERWNHLLASSRIELFYLGQQPEAEVEQAVRTLLRDLKREPLASVETALCRPARPVQKIQEAMDVTQGKLALGFRTEITVHDPRYPARMLLNAVYGAGVSSKLFLNVREKLSLCYYAFSSTDVLKGIMAVLSGIEFDKYGEALGEILAQLDAVRAGDISEAELAAARRTVANELRAGADSPNYLADFYLRETVQGTDASPDDIAALAETVTAEDVAAVARGVELDAVYFLRGEEAETE